MSDYLSRLRVAWIDLIVSASQEGKPERPFVVVASVLIPILLVLVVLIVCLARCLDDHEVVQAPTVDEHARDEAALDGKEKRE